MKLKWESVAATDITDSCKQFLTENSDKNCYLIPQKILSWLQRHIDLTLQKKIEWPTDVLSVSIFYFYFIKLKCLKYINKLLILCTFLFGYLYSVPNKKSF